MKLISEELLNHISDQARRNERLRQNYNLHESLSDSVHRLLNAVEPDTYIPPHRHKDPDKDETYIIVRGSLLTFFFDDMGNVTEKIELNPLKGNHGLEIPAGVWHSIVVLESNTVIFEIKEGPYAPLSAENIAPWAPETSDNEAVKAFIEGLRIGG